VVGHLLVYAGLDRFDNSGDATAGFWFFGNQMPIYQWFTPVFRVRPRVGRPKRKRVRPIQRQTRLRFDHHDLLRIYDPDHTRLTSS
jgi:hypothetical protein